MMTNIQSIVDNSNVITDDLFRFQLNFWIQKSQADSWRLWALSKTYLPCGQMVAWIRTHVGMVSRLRAE